MKITLLGTGSPVPMANRASSGYLLEIGDEIIFNNGSTLEKTKLVKAEVYYEQIRTYDIEVKDNHTFFANGILNFTSINFKYYIVFSLILICER